MAAWRRPLPEIPYADRFGGAGYPFRSSADAYREGFSGLFADRYAYAAPQAGLQPVIHENPPTTLPGGTLLHKGFYDLLAMIPTPSPSRLLWGNATSQVENERDIAGPRYENIAPMQRPTQPQAPTQTMPSSPPTSPSLKKLRKVSKDMVSNPTGFTYV